MVVFAVRNPGDRVHEGRRFVIVLELELARDSAAFGEGPAAQRFQKRGYLAGVESGGAGFTRLTTLIDEIGFGKCHGIYSLVAEGEACLAHTSSLYSPGH